MLSLHLTTLLLFVSTALCFSHEKRAADLASCLLSSSINTITPNNASYSNAIRPSNLRTQWFPSAVVLPTTPAEISAAIRCARASSLKVQALSGGHSYGSYGLGGANGSVIINMRYFQDIAVNEKDNTAVVGAGSKLGNVALGLYEKGKRDVPHGVCGGVGLGGHATHGGFGFTSRMWGTTLDAVVGMDVVLADGEVKYVDSKTDPDLFWALRGAGDSFGIVTAFHFKTHLAPEIGTVFNFTFPSLTLQNRTTIFLALQNFALTAPREFHLRLLTSPSSGFSSSSSFVISGVYWGPQETYLSLIGPLIAALPPTARHLSQALPYLRALASFDQNNPLAQRADSMPAPSTFFAKSLMTPVPFTSPALTSLFTLLTSSRASNSGLYWYVIHDLYGGGGSVIPSFSLDSASYAGRDALWTVQFYAMSFGARGGVFPASGTELVEDMVKAAKVGMEGTKWAAYPNYLDPSLEKEVALEAYYGAQVRRLKEVKGRVDPEEVFWNPQSVGVV